MKIIESYGFGRMVIAGSLYTGDVIIFPDGKIESPWWRRQGHAVASGDLSGLIAARPQLIICGTGAMGAMKPTVDLKAYLADHDIEFIAARSAKAVETFNQIAGRKKVGGCFHLTC